MAEVSVALTLGKQSGTLAAAIASLRRMDLEFKSHRLAELNGSGLRELTLLATGEVADPDRLANELLAVRGVEDVARIQIDGQPVRAPQQAETGEAPPTPEKAAVPEEFMRAADLEALSVPTPAREPVPEPAPAVVGRPADTDPQAINHSRMRRRRRRS